MNTREYRFGKFSLRPAQRQVLVDGQPQKLGRRGYDLLLALVARHGEVVTRDELFERVWHGRVVIDDNLKVQVMGLRALLGADAVITVPGHGYRFGLPVTRLDDRAADFDLPPTEQRDALIGRADDLANLLGLFEAGCARDSCRKRRCRQDTPRHSGGRAGGRHLWRRRCSR